MTRNWKRPASMRRICKTEDGPAQHSAVVQVLDRGIVAKWLRPVALGTGFWDVDPRLRFLMLRVLDTSGIDSQRFRRSGTCHRLARQAGGIGGTLD
jgi:hypothetical protein